MAELTEIIPDVYPAIYSLNPLSTGILNSERSGVFFRVSFTGGFSLLPHEARRIGTINTKINFAAFIISGSNSYQDRNNLNFRKSKYQN
jgi:hypothetical protein